MEWKIKKTEFEAILKELLSKGIDGRESIEKSALNSSNEAQQRDHTDVCRSELESALEETKK